MNRPVREIWFRKINLITIVSLFILILAGGIVRSSGSGMGCPDWPRCFGLYVPPTAASALPKDYKEKYVEGRVTKNQRFAKTLDFFGFSELARRIREDRSILVPDEFNAVKTWTEYLNRLIGALTGLFLLATAVYSFTYIKHNVLISILSVFNVLLVIIQAWLGSIVVSTNLVPSIVTVHMLLALAILALSISTYHMAQVYEKSRLNAKPVVRWVAFSVLLITIGQVIFGTDVRERIDAVEARLQSGYREDWVRAAGSIFYQHRDIAILVLLANIFLFVLIRYSFSKHSIQQQIMSVTFLLVMLQIVTGIALAYWSLPPVAQALHIILASLLFGSQFYLLVNLYKSVGLREIKV